MTDTIRGILFDIDGVLEYQGRVIPGAVDTIRELRERGLLLRFVTNSTMRSRASCTRRLREEGFELLEEEVFTASYLTAEYLRRIHPRSCWVMVDGAGGDEFVEFVQDREDPEYVVIGDNRSCFDFEHLSHVLRLLLRGAKLIGMQPELLDLSQGQLELNVGSWVGMLEQASRVKAIYVGKPNAFAFEVPLQSMQLASKEVVVVGDQPLTDIAGAQRLGMKTVLIPSGEFRASDLGQDIRPDLIIDRVDRIVEAWPRLTAAG